MAFFCVLSEPSSLVKVRVLKLDINFWLLPGLGRRRLYCDVGVKLSVLEAPDGMNAKPLEFKLGLPFELEEKPKFSDLSGLLYNDGGAMASLVFGNSAEPPRHVENSGWQYDDGEHIILLTANHQESLRIVKASKDSNSKYSIVSVRSEPNVGAGQVHYMRLRFLVGDSGRVWLWQKVGMRRAYAIGDFRVNEFRDLPVFENSAFNIARALPVDRINLFFVATSKLKAGRVSPAPRYVRVLERDSWEKYLQRKLSRKQGEVFVITYWRNDAKPAAESNPPTISGSEPENMSVGSTTANERSRNQFRSFIEVERRRPTAARFAIIAACISIVGFILLSNVHSYRDTVAWSALTNFWTLLVAAGSIVSAAVIVRMLPLVPKIGKYIRSGRDRLETRKYKL